jgi:hypothetical protein
LIHLLTDSALSEYMHQSTNQMNLF